LPVETPAIGRIDGAQESDIMTTVDCPFCSGPAHVEGRLDALTCDGCGVTVEVVDEAADVLEAAA
jgi:hypothetical protein